MAIDISVRTKGTWTNEDQRWIGRGGQPRSAPRSILLLRSALTAYETAGVVPSGLPLVYDSNGLAKPYLGGVHEVQHVVADATTFTLTFSGQTTSSLTVATATAAQVKAALEALSNIGAGDLTVTGTTGSGIFDVTFGGSLADTNVAQMTGTGTGGAATVTVTTTTAGAADADETGIGFLFASVALDRLSTANVAAALFWDGEVITNYLPTSQLDAEFRADVAHTIQFVTNVV
jgi:hypothetical protein